MSRSLCHIAGLVILYALATPSWAFDWSPAAKPAPAASSTPAAARPSQPAITPKQIKAEYDRLTRLLGDREYHVAHILTKDRAAAEAVIAELRAGKPFAEVAAARSTDSGSAARGGDLGWSSPNLYVPAFAAAVRLQLPGSFTDEPVQTAFGWHVIRVIEERPLRVMSLAAIQTPLREKLRRGPPAATLTNEDQRIVRRPYLIERAREAVAAGVDLDKPGPHGATLLFDAAALDDLAAVKLLLEKGANSELPSTAGIAALDLAAGNGNAEMFKLLLAAHSHAARPRPFSPALAIAAVNGGNLEILSTLIAAGVDPNGKGARGVTPLMIAAMDGKTELVNYLLSVGANPIALDMGPVYQTPLDYAWMGDHADTLAVLERAARPRVLAKSSATLKVFVEQNGKRQPAGGTVSLERAPFRLIFETAGDAQVFLNASFKRTLFDKFTAGDMTGLMTSRSGAIGAEGGKSDQLLFVSDEVAQSWMDNDEAQRFDAVERAPGRFVGTRTIRKVLAADTDKDDKPIESLDGGKLYLVFCLNEHIGSFVMVPTAASQLHIVWKPSRPGKRT